MIIESGSKRIMEPKATVWMTDGDRLSISYNTVHGESRIVVIDARALALVVKELSSGDELFIQPRINENVFMEGYCK